MNRVSTLRSIFSQRTIAFRREFVEPAGGVLPALFLSQATYWQAVAEERGEEWWYKTQTEWTTETGLSEKEQLTFGPYDDSAPAFSTDGNLLFHVSNEDDHIFNLRSLDLETGDIIQYTDTLGGNFAPAVVLDESDDEQLLFTSYYKGEYGLYRLSLEEPVKEIAADQIIRTEGPVIDFVPPVLHQDIAVPLARELEG